MAPMAQKDDMPEAPKARPAKPDQPHACPTCAAIVAVDAKHLPFCSERCRLADLNNWFRERYVISRKIEEKDLDEGGS